MMLTNQRDPPRRYFKLHYLLFRFLGLGWWHHPDEENTENFPGVYIFYSVITELVWIFGFVGLESIDPFIGEKEMDRFMFSLSFVITHDLTIIKIYIFFFKNREIQDIVHTLEISLGRYYQNNTKNWKTVKITRVLSGLFFFFGWMTILNGTVYGIIQDIRWKAEVSKLNDTSIKPPRSLPQAVYVPWNYENDESYIPTLILENIGLLWTGHIVLGIDTFIGSLILHMSSQFEIMQEALTTAYDRTILQLSQGVLQRNDENESNYEELLSTDDADSMNLFDNSESIVRRHCTEEEIEIALENTLKDCFRQHELLISCVEKFAKTYSYGFMTQLLSSMAAICVVMVQLSQDASSLKSMRIVTSLAFFAAMVIQLGLQCFSGNELTYQAGKVADAVMQCQWERMPPRLRKLLVMTLIRAQRPLQLTAAGFATINNDCFLAIMKAAYSYYAVLSQKQGN